jgi:dienelactone hydrolase
MAAQYASHAPPVVKGLVLWASYPASGNDLSKRGISVVTIRGALDGLVSSAQIEESMRILPTDSVRVEIEGGNHAQFGWYGPQPGDNEATISREAQQERVVEATLQLLQRIG